VTATVYDPNAPAATVKDPYTVPLVNVHCGFDMRLFGDDEIVHVVSLESKPKPETATFVPTGPEVGDNVTVGGL
jgi:hypothetical protein